MMNALPDFRAPPLIDEPQVVARLASVVLSRRVACGLTCEIDLLFCAPTSVAPVIESARAPDANVSSGSGGSLTSGSQVLSNTCFSSRSSRCGRIDSLNANVTCSYSRLQLRADFRANTLLCPSPQIRRTEPGLHRRQGGAYCRSVVQGR